MATPTRPTTTALCTFTEPDTEDPGKAYSAPIATDCAAPSGLTIGEEIDTTFDEDGNPVFGPAPEDDSSEGSGVNADIESHEDLAAVETVDIEIGSADAIIMWIDEATGVFQVWQLETGTDAHDPFGGVIRPDDYNVVSNAKVWLKRS